MSAMSDLDVDRQERAIKRLRRIVELSIAVSRAAGVNYDNPDLGPKERKQNLCDAMDGATLIMANARALLRTLE